MKYAIMSDVHANPKALEMALEDARRHGCERFYMLGDTTGYGYDAVGALELVRNNFDVVLMGNHDSVCLGLEPSFQVLLNPNYDIDREQREELSCEQLEWLKNRHYLLAERDMAFAHGEFVRPKSWGYIFSTEDAVRNFFSSPERLLFCGHSHHAAIWEMTEKGRFQPKFEKRFESPAIKSDTVSFKLRDGSRYIINVGSVGYPRNDLCSTYVIYDTDAARISYRRMPFDFKSYIESMLSKGLELSAWLAKLLSMSK